MTAIRGAAAITGAASGIGRALAIELAQRGCDLALADRDEAGLKALAAEIGGARKVSVHRVDVGEPADVAQFASEAIAAHPALGIVVNNAGVALMGSFDEIDQAQMDWLFDINFWGVVHGTRAFLPHLKTLAEAHIVNLSSIFGIIAPPGQSAYAAAKFAVRGFSESVRHELAMAASPVKLSVVHPGGVATDDDDIALVHVVPVVSRWSRGSASRVVVSTPILSFPLPSGKAFGRPRARAAVRGP